MDNNCFLEIEKMRERLKPALEAWRAKVYVSLVTTIVYSEVDTSSSYSEQVGAVTVVQRPETRLKVRIGQIEEFPKFEIPYMPDYEIKPEVYAIRAHAEMLAVFLSETAPTPEQWEDA